MAINISPKQAFPALLFLVVICLKLWLVDGQDLTALGHSTHDDRLFLNLARSILNGQWLGPYNNLTLVKGPVYPLWIAAVSSLGIPLLLAQHLLYIFACLITAVALRPLVRNPLLQILIFSLLLFNPMSFSSGIMTQVIREGIYPALALLVIASAIGFLLRIDQSISMQIPWTTGLGLSVAALWFTREEGVWIIPSILVFSLCVTVKIVKSGHGSIRRFSPLTLPLIIWVIFATGLCLLNKTYYGVFTSSETKSSEFLEAYGALTRVLHEQWNPTVPVPHEARMRIYSASQAFSELKPYLEGDGGSNWRNMFKVVREIAARDPEAFVEIYGVILAGDPSGIWSEAIKVDEPHGGWFLWAIRDAAAAAGHHQSAPAALAFYQEIADEVNKACNEGTLHCGHVRATFMPPLYHWYLSPFLKTMGNGMLYLAGLEGFKVTPAPSYGGEDLLQLFREMTHEQIYPAEFQIRGSLVSRSSDVSMTLRTTKGTPVTSIPLLPTLALQGPFALGESRLPDATKTQFNVKSSMNSPAGVFRSTWFLTIESDSKILLKVPLDGSINQIENNHFLLSFESAGMVNGPSPVDMMKLGWLDKIARIYRFFLMFAAGTALVFYVFSTIKTVNHRSMPTNWIIASILAIAILVRLFILSLIHVTSFPAIIPPYLSPAYPLLILLIVVCLLDGVEMIKERKREQWSGLR